MLMFGWFDGGAKLTARYLAFMTEIPEGMTGVRDVRLAGAEIVVEPQGVSETLRIGYSPELFARPERRPN